MEFFKNPLPFRMRSLDGLSSPQFVNMASAGAVDVLQQGSHTSHPDFGHLVLLVFEAVLEVVCVSAPGYIVARQGMFDAEAQKFVANLNVILFTPCLIFTKLASQLTADKLVELAVIPFIFVVQTLVSFLVSYGVSKAFRFKKRPRNFVIAMGVFGNSNSLPISLVISLSKTLKGLHWDRIPGDNDDEVAARGILYLLIFQQLGQLVRWTWGYNVLLAPPDKYTVEEGGTAQSRLERGDAEDGTEDERQNLLLNDDSEEASSQGADAGAHSDYESGSITPVTQRQYASSASLSSILEPECTTKPANGVAQAAPSGGLAVAPQLNKHRQSIPRYDTATHITTFPNPNPAPVPNVDIPPGLKGWLVRCKLTRDRMCLAISTRCRRVFESLPPRAQKVLAKTYRFFRRFLLGVWEFMNMPLWAMLAAIVVASVPPLQHLFFDEGTFINNSVTRAISQSGGVAVPLILVVLGANLARNTLPKEDAHSFENPKEERNLLIAALISRMLLPTVIMAPLLALTAKYVPVSILDDPIFVIVCFLLTGAPSALQLAQICQINNVYMGAMSRLLFQSYVIWILPSTLILVMLALEVVEWAA